METPRPDEAVDKTTETVTKETEHSEPADTGDDSSGDSTTDDSG